MKIEKAANKWQSIVITLIFFVSFGVINSEIIWEDNFESDTNWILSGEFQIGVPQGLGGEHGNPDPTSAYQGLKILGTDLSGLGNYPGDYEPNLGDHEYFAVSPPIDCSGFVDVQLSFMNWLGIEQPAYDHAYIEVSNDNGSTWLSVWENTTTISDNSWSLESYDISAFADLEEEVRIRFSVGSTDGSWQYCGWNIDLLSVSGNSVGFGEITGIVFDNETGIPISNAQIMSQFGFDYSDENGMFELLHIPEGLRSISVSAIGYQEYFQDDIVVVADDTTFVSCALELNPFSPPSPSNLAAEIFDGYNVHLTWEEPEDSEFQFIAYNIYRNNVIIQSVITNDFTDENLVCGEYLYYVTAVYNVGTSLPTNEVNITIDGTVTENDEIPVKDFSLNNFPNPFRTSTTISFELSTEQNEQNTISIYNVKGQKIKTLECINRVDAKATKSLYSITWDGKDDFGKPVAAG
ncbi:MAG: hypothetical protein DRZ79_04770, partial [Candidatus Cloacimonadota bacterium]